MAARPGRKQNFRAGRLLARTEVRSTSIGVNSVVVPSAFAYGKVEGIK